MKQATEKWQELDLNKKVLTVMAGAVALTVTAGAVNLALKPNYTLYNHELSEMAMPEVVAALDAAGIHYKVGNNGQLLVDENSHTAVNGLLMKSGLPQPEIKGYAHLLENQTVYTSQIKENLFNTQILEEELAKLVLQINGVVDAKVKLALSKESQFLRDTSPAKASVVVTMDGQSRLSKKQVTGIVSVVASGITNLDPQNVVIMDQTGRVLSSVGEDGFSGTPQMEYKVAVESRVEQKVISILAPIVGMDALRVNVSADINFDKVENTQDVPVEQTVLISEQVERDTDANLSGGQGVPGALSNQPPDQTSFDDKSKSVSGSEKSSVGREKYTKNYDIGRSITHTQQASRDIEKLSIAVLLDSTFFETPQAYQDAQQAIVELIGTSVGFSAERGDVITVNALEFKKAPVIEPEPEEFYETAWFEKLIEAVKWLGLSALFWLGIWRPLLNRISPPPAVKGEDNDVNDMANMSDEDIMAMTGGAFDFGSDGSDGDAEKFQSEQNKAYKVMEQQQDLALKILEGWVNGTDFSKLSEPEGATFSEVVSEDEEALMAAMMEEHMNEGEAK
nr:flagellar basal-body MS-ring/collar protein FliF [Vibrio crassostreae]